MKFKKLLLATITVWFGIMPSSVMAFKLTPEGSFIERKLAKRSSDYLEKILEKFILMGIHKIGDPVHEEITNRILGCEGDAGVCGNPEYDPRNAYFLAGVRWNDDPPFRFESKQGRFFGCETNVTIRLNTFPLCWGSVFKDGERRAKKGVSLNGSNATLLVRSHFGDMQFLHAMANHDGENPVTVRERIITWSEFTWRTALGEFSTTNRVQDIPIVGLSEFFRSTGWSVQDLFALGNPHIRQPNNMSEVAFGSLLHVIQDSFAAGHVERTIPDSNEKCPVPANMHAMPGKIKEFHSYVNQDSDKHGEDDNRAAFSASWSQDKPNIIDIGRVLNGYFVRRASWVEVKPYIECIFTLDSHARSSSAGEKYNVEVTR